MTDDERAYRAAVDTFMTEPEALTLDQLETLKAADATLGERAITRRREASIAAAAARHRRAIGEPPTKHDRADAMADAVLDVVTVALVKSRQRLAATRAGTAGARGAAARARSAAHGRGRAAAAPRGGRGLAARGADGAVTSFGRDAPLPALILVAPESAAGAMRRRACVGRLVVAPRTPVPHSAFRGVVEDAAEHLAQELRHGDALLLRAPVGGIEHLGRHPDVQPRRGVVRVEPWAAAWTGHQAGACILRR